MVQSALNVSVLAAKEDVDRFVRLQAEQEALTEQLDTIVMQTLDWYVQTRRLAHTVACPSTKIGLQSPSGPDIGWEWSIVDGQLVCEWEEYYWGDIERGTVRFDAKYLYDAEARAAFQQEMEDAAAQQKREKEEKDALNKKQREAEDVAKMAHLASQYGYRLVREE